MAIEYNLPYTAVEIEEKLGKIDRLSTEVEELKVNKDGSYTNVLLTAVASDSTSVYNGTGYKADTRWSSSSNTEQTAAGIYLTGWIPCEIGDTIYLKNITMPYVNGNSCILHFFNNSFTTATQNLGVNSGLANFTIVTDADNNVTQFTIPSNVVTFTHIRIQCAGITEDSIITINEEISEDETEVRVTNIESSISKLDARMSALEEICNDASYTNVLTAAVSRVDIETVLTDGNTKGYLNDSRFTSSGGNIYIDCPGWDVSGLIPVKVKDIIRLKNITVQGYTTIGSTGNHGSIQFFNADGTYLSAFSLYLESEEEKLLENYGGILDENNNLIQFTVPNWDIPIEFFSITCQDINENSIITVNEEISADKTEARVSALESAVAELNTKIIEGDIPDYWQIALEEGAESINTALCEAGSKKSAFLFYTDAHWNYNSQMSPKLLKYLYEHTGITKTFFGGDIVNNEATDYDTMKYLWEWRNMLKGLPNHHSVVGNHDDGNATNNLFSEKYVYGYLLAAEETPDIVRGNSGMYYYIDNSPEKTRYIFLDTAYQGVNSAQQEFIKQALLTTAEGWHIIAISHIWHDTDWTDASNPVVGELTTDALTILTMFDNYNSRVGEYADCGGWVEFCVGGHTHWDYDSTSITGIPIILVETDSMHVRSDLTYTSGTTTESSVNGIIADYDNHKIYVVRIGRGESREIEVTNYVVSYTNVLPTSIDLDGDVFNGKGFKENTRLSSSSSTGIADADNLCTTGYIPIASGDVVRLANITMKDVNSTGRVCIGLYEDLSTTQLLGVNHTDLAKYWNGKTDGSGNLIEFTISTSDNYQNVAYMRITADVIDETSIITINEPIE